MIKNFSDKEFFLDGFVAPQNLYKYKSLDNLQFVFDILFEKQLYFSSVDQFNDPMEFNFNLEFEKDINEKINFFKNNSKYKLDLESLDEVEIKSKISSFETEYFNSRFEHPTKFKYGVFCFSSTPINSALWSYYASNHQGICIEFEVLNRVDKIFKEVSYKENLPRLNFYDQEKWDKDASILFSTKHMHFYNEQEYRCFAEPKESLKFENLMKINKLFLGLDIEKHSNFCKFISKLANNLPDLPIVTLESSKTKYELVEAKITTSREYWNSYIRSLQV